MTPDEDLTIEQEVAAALESHKAAQEAPEPEAAPEAEAEPVSEGPTRGPDGKFVAKEGEQTGQETPTEGESPVVPDKFALAPSYAKKGIREKWSDLPLEVRQELHEREADFHRQITRQDEERTFGKRVREVVGPYEGFIRQLGADPVQAVDYLIKTDYALRTAPPEQRKALFLKAASDYGISFGQEELQQQPQYTDPRLETLEQRLQRLEYERQSAIQETQLAEQRSIEQQIADFASKPEHAFFDRVAPTVAALLQSGSVDSLEKAYEMAVYADPETRALQLAAEQSQRNPNQKRAAAEQAKRASVSVTGAPGVTAPASSPVNANSTIEDDIRAAIAASGRI